MKFALSASGTRTYLSISDLSDAQIRQAAFMADAVARLIPHRGVDYDIALNGSMVSFLGITDKGRAWSRRLADEFNGNPPDLSGENPMLDLESFIGRQIPNDGVDYDVVIVFHKDNPKSVSFRIEPRNERGEFWRDYVAEMIRKYPPIADYRGVVLEENPPPVTEEIDK